MTEPRWLSRSEQDTWVSFAAVLELLPRELDAQLQRDETLTHFDYFTLAMLSEAEDRTLRMTALASMTNSTLPRLSHVISRLEKRGYVRREQCAEDARATNAVMTEQGWQKIVQAAPGHVENVRSLVFDPLTAEQLRNLHEISAALLRRLDPEGRMMASARSSSGRE